MNEINPDDLKSFGRWEPLIAFLTPSIYRSLIQQKVATDRASLNFNNPRSVDHFLFDTWKYKLLDFDLHFDVIEQGIKLAVDNKNSSLIETLILVLAERAIDYPDLIRVAIEQSKENKKLKRALYNKLREQLVEVRDFKGDGQTIFF